MTEKEQPHLLSKIIYAGICIGLLLLVTTVIIVVSSEIFVPSNEWTTNAPPLQENIVTQIPNYQNATYCLAWIESANPYVREGMGLFHTGAQNLTETYGIVSLPHNLTFNTHWNNATLKVIYYNYETLNATFDHSTLQQTKYVQTGDVQTYFLDLTKLSVETTFNSKDETQGEKQ